MCLKKEHLFVVATLFYFVHFKADLYILEQNQSNVSYLPPYFFQAVTWTTYIFLFGLISLLQWDLWLKETPKVGKKTRRTHSPVYIIENRIKKLNVRLLQVPWLHYMKSSNVPHQYSSGFYDVIRGFELFKEYLNDQNLTICNKSWLYLNDILWLLNQNFRQPKFQNCKLYSKFN